MDNQETVGNRMIDAMSNSIDLAALMDRLAGDRELLHELIGLYLDDEQALIDKVAAAISAGDATRLARSAHTLKGSVGNFCAAGAQAAATALEVAAREGRLAEAQPLFDRLTAELDKVRGALRSLAAGEDS
jgi:two-component system sensor histidine kinase/response regulator